MAWQVTDGPIGTSSQQPIGGRLPPRATKPNHHPHRRTPDPETTRLRPHGQTVGLYGYPTHRR